MKCVYNNIVVIFFHILRRSGTTTAAGQGCTTIELRGWIQSGERSYSDIIRMKCGDVNMKLDDVKSINEIWEEAKKGGLITLDNVLRYEYMFESGERVAFTWELSQFIENDPDIDALFATNFNNNISNIKAAHAKGHVCLIPNPHI